MAIKNSFYREETLIRTNSRLGNFQQKASWVEDKEKGEIEQKEERNTQIKQTYKYISYSEDAEQKLSGPVGSVSRSMQNFMLVENVIKLHGL